MAKSSPQTQPMRDYQAEIVDGLARIAKALEKDNHNKNKWLSRATDVRSIGNAAVIALVIEQGFREGFDIAKAKAGLAVLALMWIMSYFIEKGGAD